MPSRFRNRSRRRSIGTVVSVLWDLMSETLLGFVHGANWTSSTRVSRRVQPKERERWEYISFVPELGVLIRTIID